MIEDMRPVAHPHVLALRCESLICHSSSYVSSAPFFHLLIFSLFPLAAVPLLPFLHFSGLSLLFLIDLIFGWLLLQMCYLGGLSLASLGVYFFPSPILQPLWVRETRQVIISLYLNSLIGEGEDDSIPPLVISSQLVENLKREIPKMPGSHCSA